MNLESGDECDIKLVEDNYFIVSSELSMKMNAQLEQEYAKEGILSKKEGIKIQKQKETGI